MSSNSIFSTPELWVHGILDFLAFSSIIPLEQVNHFLRDQAFEVTRPSKVGVFPTQIWIENILPLLSYKELKKFQQTSQVAKRLTQSKSLAGALFRSDVDLAALKKMKVGARIQLHPFVDKVSFSIGQSYERMCFYVKPSNPNDRSLRVPAHLYQAANENASNPAVSSLSLDVWEGSGHIATAVGTGKPLFGSNAKAVTCKDLLKTFAEHSDLFSHAEVGHPFYEGFYGASKTNKGFLISGAAWGS